MSLGSYPEITLAAARVKREEVKRALIEGHDPMAPRRVNRQGMTLAEATETYWQGRKDVSATYRTNALRGIELHLVRLTADADKQHNA